MQAENIPNQLGGGAPATIRKPSLSTPFSAASTPQLSTPAQRKQPLSVARAPLGDMTNRKKPATSSNLPSKSTAAVTDAQLLADMIGSSAMSVSSAATCLFGTDDSPLPIEQMGRRATPTGPVSFDRSGFDVEGAVAQLCARGRPFVSPCRSTAAGALQHPPHMVELHSPAVVSGGAHGGGAMSAAAAANAARRAATSAGGGGLLLPAATSAGGAASSSAGGAAAAAGLTPPLAVRTPQLELELDLSGFVARREAMTPDDSDEGEMSEGCSSDMELDDADDCAPPPPPAAAARAAGDVLLSPS